MVSLLLRSGRISFTKSGGISINVLWASFTFSLFIIDFYNLYGDIISVLINIDSILLFWYIQLPAGIFFALFATGIFIARPLKNNPYSMVDGVPVKNTFGFFTGLTPGQVKIIERDGNFIRCAMNYPGHTYRGLVSEEDIQSNTGPFWEVIPTPEGKEDASPIPFPKFNLLIDIIFVSYRYPWYWWKRFVRKYTGLVFTGIPPFQTIRLYPIEYHRESTDAGGKFILTRNKNFSDFYNVKKFDVFVPIAASDTSDLLPLKVVVGFTAKVFNPWLAAYNTGAGGWSTRVYRQVPSAVLDYTRKRDLIEVMTGEIGTNSKSKVPADVDKIKVYNMTGLADSVLELGVAPSDNETLDPSKPVRKFHDFGIYISDVTIPERSIADESSLTATQIKLADAVFAARDKLTAIIRAEGQAEANTLIAKAIAEQGDVGRLAAVLAGYGNIVKEAGNNAVINLSVGGGESGIPTLNALYKETKDQNSTK